MVACAYCERPLICDSCQDPYAPPRRSNTKRSPGPRIVITCPRCGQVLVCHWCKTPYDGEAEEETEARGSAGS